MLTSSVHSYHSFFFEKGISPQPLHRGDAHGLTHITHIRQFGRLLSNSMETVKIRSTVIVEAILEKLCLPRPKYQRRILEGSQCVVVTVVFYRSMQQLECFATQSLSSDLSDSLETFKNNIAVQAIKYMEMVQKAVKDFSHTKLEKKKGNEVLLTNKEKDEKIG